MEGECWTAELPVEPGWYWIRHPLEVSLDDYGNPHRTLHSPPAEFLGPVPKPKGIRRYNEHGIAIDEEG